MDAKQMYERHALTEGRVVESGLVVSPRDAFVVQALAERAPTGGEYRVAELSIGDGGLTRAIARRLPSCHVVGFEISTTRIADVRKTIPDGANVTLLECDLDSPFHEAMEAPFHSVVAMDILEHVFDVFGFVESCARMLLPGGALILRVPNVAYVRRRWTLLTGALPVTASWFGPPGTLNAWKEQYGWDGCHLHFFTLASLKDLLELYGLAVVYAGDPGARFERMRRALPGLLCGNLAVVAERR